MEKYTEYIYLDQPQYYSQYIIVPFTDIRVSRVDENQNELYELSMKAFGSSLSREDFSVDVDRGLFIFSPDNIGNLFKIEYYSEGEINPFKVSENLFQFAETMLMWASYRIVDGLYFYQEDFDNEYILRLKQGSFVYNSNFYTCKEVVYDFRGLASPTVPDKFRGYMFYINKTKTIDNHTNYYQPLRYIKEPSILYTNSLYDFQYQAKSELIGRYREIYGNEHVLIIAFVYLRVDTNYRFWIEYHKESRGININI